MENNLFDEPSFRRIVVGSTGLGLALMFASLASIRMNNSAGLQFTWHWTILLWMIAAAIWNWRFWTVVWRAVANPTPAAKRKLFLYMATLAGFGIGAFLYPIQFIERSHLNGIL